MSKYPREETATFLDRFGVGFLSAVCFFITFYLFSFTLFLSGMGVMFLMIPFKIIILLTLLFFVLGFVTLDNYFIKIITPAWKFLDEALRP